jgi:two-component system, cell cycle sensor histidine kinase and response regulator CckA
MTAKSNCPSDKTTMPAEPRGNQTAQQDSGEQYRLWFECNPHPMWVYALDTLSFLAVNDAAVHKYGYSREEFLHMTITEIRPPDEVGRLKANISHLTEGLDAAGRWSHQLKDGTIIEVEITSHQLIFDGLNAEMVLAHDITERIRAEKSLKEREEQLASIFRAAPVGIGMVINRIIQEANDCLCQMTGFSREELIGQNSRMLYVSDEDYDLVGREKYRQIREEGTGTIETRWRRKDGSIMHLILSSSPLEGNNLLKGVTFTALDITERKQAESVLLQYQLLSQNTRDIILFIRAADGRIMEANDAAVEAYGYTREELLTKRIFNLRLPEVRDQVARQMENANTCGALFETLHLRKNGTVFPVEVSSRGMSVGDERILMSIIRDITSRKQAEEALRQSEERFRATLYSIGDAVITTDAGGAVCQMNHVAEAMTAWREEDARGKPVEEVFKIVDEETGRPIGNPVTQVLQRGIVVGLADRAVLMAKDGTRKPIADSGAPILGVTGDMSGVVLVFNDQSEKRELQAQLLHAQKMEAVGRLAGGIAHDFNNMIGVILGYANLMESQLSSLDPLYRQVQAIATAAERSASLTMQLLAFARKQVIAPVLLNLNDSLSALQRMLTRLIGEDIALKLIPGEGLWNIRIDPSQVDQILANFATNARDAINDVGKITIETANIRNDQSPLRDCPDCTPGDYVMLSFSDNGKGMDRATQERIFEPFFTTKSKGQGTGLGLATVFGIVKQNNGFIHVRSGPGKGSTFKVYFPRFHGEAERDDRTPQDMPLKGTETILIVEDEIQLLELACAALEMQGYKVLAARSPGEALIICERTERAIDLMITDVVMPDMNGKELKDRLSSLKPGMKTIFMSGYTSDIVADRGVLEKGVSFLQKPFTPSMLAQKVREVLKG